jgi:hypothetical protein
MKEHAEDKIGEIVSTIVMISAIIVLLIALVIIFITLILNS